MIAVQGLFMLGPLSQPVWVPISYDRACQTSDDPIFKPAPFAHRVPMTDVTDCQALCASTSGCQAVDWFNTTRWCNLYTEACQKPTANWDHASAYQIAVSCLMHNGSTGVLIAGHCQLGIAVPTVSSIVSSEIPVMLTSPKSWAFSLVVAIIYTYIMSAWFRQKLQPVLWPFTTGGSRCLRWTWSNFFRRFVFLALLAMAWAYFTVREWGPPPASSEELVQAYREWSLTEWLWMGGSALAVVLLFCKGFRSCLVSIIVALGS